ncbi:MAG TPA: hypothetical protein VJK54_06305, partial [Chthoniobacterales bacterium]|nr:hypothetical protein [Chthoniobacterales bacterium]
RELLREARAKHAVINDSEASKLDRSMVEGSEKSSPKNKKQADVLALEQQAKVEIMAESLKPEAKDRLELLVKENQLRQEAVVMAKEAKLLRETQAEENALSTEKDDQGSMISRVTKISGSVLGSIFGGSSTTVKSSSYVVGSTARPRDLETVIAEAGGLEQQWKKLMEEAEKARIEQGGAPLDPSLIMDTWKEADTTVIAAQQEQEKIQKEHAIAARRKEKWSANTARWKARIQADELAVAAQKSEEKAASLFEEELEIKAKLGAKEKEKQDADEQTAVAKKEAASAKTAAFKAEEEWEALAMSHHNMIAAQKEGGTAVQAALDKLRKSDQAVKDLWYNLTSSYAEDEIREQGDEEAEQQRIKKELDDCKIKKIVDETSCFEGVTIARAKAKEAYLKAKTPESKEATKPLYDDVDRLELKAYQDYTERVKNDALESARKRIPGMEAVWIERMTESEKKRETKANAILFKVPCKDAWADENQRDLMHSTAIAAADEEACKTFQNEEKRLADIEALWKAVIEAKKKALITSPKNAAQAYVEGDKSAWLALSAEERQAYNQEISDANEVYTTKAATIIELAEERVAQALREVEKRKYSVRDAIGISNKKQLALEALERAEAGLAIVQAAEKERKKALGWIDQKSREAKIEQLSQNIQQTLKEGLDFDSQTSAAIHAAAQIASQASSHPKLASEFCDDSRMLDFLALMMEQDCMVMEDYLAAVKAYRSLNHQAAAYWIKAAEASCEAANGYMKACATLWGGNKALNRLFFYYTSETTQKNFSELEDAIAQQNEYATLVALQFEMAAKNYSLTAQAILRRESESIISNLLHQAEAEDKKASFMKKAWPVSTNHYLRSRHLSVRSGFVYLDPSFSAYFDLSEDMESKDMD